MHISQVHRPRSVQQSGTSVSPISIVDGDDSSEDDVIICDGGSPGRKRRRRQSRADHKSSKTGHPVLVSVVLDSSNEDEMEMEEEMVVGIQDEVFKPSSDQGHSSSHAPPANGLRTLDICAGCGGQFTVYFSN